MRVQILTVVNVDTAVCDLVQDHVCGADGKATLHAGQREQQQAMNNRHQRQVSKRSQPVAWNLQSRRNMAHCGMLVQHRAVGSLQVLKQGTAQESYLH